MLRIVEIKALSNGAHRNQSYPGFVPDGWALIPEDMEMPNFPFGEVAAESVTHYEDVIKTEEVHVEDENGIPVTEHRETIVQEPYTVMTVTKWTPGEMPEPEAPTPAQKREDAYNTQPIVEWEGEPLTITQAATKWQYYAAEGSDKADELQELIATAKQTIRIHYPDKEGDE